MSVTMSRAEGVAVFTLTSDPQSRWPPLCQILKALCYSPACCSLSPALRGRQRPSLSILGAMQIMTGLLTIGLSVILTIDPVGSVWQLRESGLSYWMGILFIVFGILCILSERYPSPCLVTINVILNLAGVGFSIAAIVIYSINIAKISLGDYCEWHDCMDLQKITLVLLRGVNGILIVLCTLELCVVISSVVLGIKALRGTGNEQKESPDDSELHKPLLEDV
ncbi:membrane-spanning 4-domains subfamily A member 6C-like [Menidia menidia]